MILKIRNKILAEDITKDRINCDVIQTICGIPIEEIPELKLYKSRNEKAIEYIKKHKSTSPIITSLLVDSEIIELESILQGEDKDE